MIKAVPPNFGGYKDNFSESLLIMGRLKPGISIAEATSNVNLLFQQILRGFPDAKLSQENLRKLDETKVPLTPMATGLSSLRRQFSEPLQILMASGGAGSAHRLRQHRQSAPCPIDRARSGTGCPPGARSPAFAHHPSADY